MSRHRAAARAFGRKPARAVAVLGALALVATGAAAIGAPAEASGSFTAGDVVVYRVGAGASALGSAGAAVFLDEYDASGTVVQSVPLPTAASGANHRLVASGSATSEGGLTLSADGRFLVSTGYDAAVGTTGLSGSASASVPRTVALVDASGTVDSSTALTDFADANNPRSAVSSDGTRLWVGGAAGGVRTTTVGSTTSTSIVSTTYKNVRQLEIANGQLYTSADPTKASATVATVGTGLPTTTGQAVTNLPFASSPTQPYGYSFLTLGSGTAPDTLYVADNSAGAVVKYSLVGGTWTAKGSVAVPYVTGVAANDTAGVVTVFATGAGSAGTTGTLSKFTDTSGAGGTLTGSATAIASAPANEAFRGIAFTPGTTIGSGGPPPPVLPTVAVAHTGLPAALGDPENPTDDITIGHPTYPATALTVSASSSDPTVAPAAGVSITGTGATRVLHVTPGAVGHSTITLTVTAPDATSVTTTVDYAVSADQGDSSDRYLSGAGNASAAVDVGGGYMVVGDDESDVLRLYPSGLSGPPVKTFDFTSILPFGNAEVDLEGAARSGDTIYWLGSMSNNSSGALAPARSTLFATHVSGTGADTTLTYVGSYTGLQNDLVAWDQSGAHGLGANHFGLYTSVHSGIASHQDDALNLEGLEFAAGSSTTAYLAFRAPLGPTNARTHSLVVPVTNFADLVTHGNPGTTTATFGAPLSWDLGGLGIRDLRANAAGQFLILAGSADGTNPTSVVYEWDGNPADPPAQTGTTAPPVPSGADRGAWEAVVAVPSPLNAGAPIRLLEDNGDTAWYGDSATSKSGLAGDLQKDLERTFSYAPPTTIGVSVNPGVVARHGALTVTADVDSADNSTAGRTGSVEFFADGTSLGTVSTDDGTSGEYRLHLPDVTLASSATPYQVSAVFTPTNPVYGAATSPDVPLTVTPTDCPGTPDDDASCVDPQSIQAEVVPGSLTITTPYTDSNPFVLPPLELNPAGTRLSTSARFPALGDPQIVVTSTLAGDPDWTVLVTGTDLVGAGGSINGENVGLTGGTLDPSASPAFPGVVAFTDVPAADGVAPSDVAGGGLEGGPHEFAHTTGGGNGSASMYGTLTVNAPTETVAGAYDGTITFSVS